MPKPKVTDRIEKAAQAFEAWRATHPGARFRDFYVAKVTAQLDAGKPHATLGKNLKGEEAWHEAGREMLETLVERGLREEHVIVDYGCGSLRLGQHLMRHVAPGNYWGLDITDRFMQDGVEMLGPEVVATRRPNLRVIGPEALAEVRAARPDFVIAMAVLIHVPPEEADDFWDELMSVVVEGTRAFVNYKAADEIVRYSGRSWAYPEREIETHVTRRGGNASFEPRGEEPAGPEHAATRRGWVRIERAV